MSAVMGRETTVLIWFLQTSDFAIHFSGIDNSISKKVDSEFSNQEMCKNSVEEIYTNN